jgi:hypothetical protein
LRKMEEGVSNLSYPTLHRGADKSLARPDWKNNW